MEIKVDSEGTERNIYGHINRRTNLPYVIYGSKESNIKKLTYINMVTNDIECKMVERVTIK